MQIVLKLSHQDIARLAEGGRVEVHSGVFIEIDEPLQDQEIAEIARSVRRNSSPPKYLPCAACHGTGFIDDSCCRECEGTARILIRPQVSVGDWVRIVTFVMSPWGFLVMPRPTPTRDRVCIPSGTVGVVVDIEQGGIAGDDPSFVIDLILDKVLYRVVVESQYVKTLGVGNDKNASNG